jgi:D-alanyl-D-alanine carboxypeptidase
VAVRGISALSLVFLMTLAGCTGLRTRDETVLLSQLQQELDAAREREHLPGLTAAVLLHDGSLLSLASGLADTLTGGRMPIGAVMPAGSVGKEFVAAVALALAREHRIDLDVTIDRWFRDAPWFERVPNAHAMTLRMLLMHRAGVPDHRQSAGFLEEIAARFAERPYDPDFRIPPQTLVSYVFDTPPLFAPGQGYSYSETGYILAGLALERGCRCNYYQELERLFLQPLHLEHTHPATVRNVAGLVQGHIGTVLPAFPPLTMCDGQMLFSPATEWTGGGLFSNVDDLVRWSSALYEGHAMPGAYVEELLRGDLAIPSEPDSYGLGVRHMMTPLGRAYGHGGEFPGYLSFVWYFPGRHVAVAVQTNTASANLGVLYETALALTRIAFDRSR